MTNSTNSGKDEPDQRVDAAGRTTPLIILDDIEHPDLILTPEEREELAERCRELPLHLLEFHHLPPTREQQQIYVKHTPRPSQ